MSTALAFQSTVFDVVDHDSQIWIQSSQLAQALGYSDERKVSHLYSRHSDEFSNDMSVVLNLGTTGIPTKTRLFSLRGCHLIAMFARTSVAKAFRVWVLDVLDKLNSASTPSTSAKLTPSTAADRQPLKELVDAWVGTSPISYSAAWKQVNAHFSITKSKFLPKEWIPDAIAFVQARIDMEIAAKARQPELPTSATDALASELIMSMLAGISANGAQFPQAVRPNPTPKPSVEGSYSWLNMVAPAVDSVVQTLTGLGASREQMSAAVEAMIKRMVRTFVDTRLAQAANHRHCG